MSNFAEFYSARNLIVDVLEKDLIGPVAEDEVLEDLPTSYYIAGKLYPQRSDSGLAEQEESSDLATEIDFTDEPISLANQREPSAMGMTFALSGNPTLNIKVSFATYEGDTKLSMSSDAKSVTGHWSRIAHSKSLTWTFSSDKRIFPLGNGVILQIVPRHRFSDETTLLTASLVNTTRASNTRAADARQTVFQPSIKLELFDGKGQFEDVDRSRNLISDEELVRLELLYRNTHCYAQGHGCSVTWDESSSSPQWLSTTFFPRVKIPQMKPRTIEGLDAFSIQFLCQAPTSTICKELTVFVEMYDRWIDEQRSILAHLTDKLRKAAENNIRDCATASSRIKRSIHTLETDPQVMRAFRLANEAMLLQRECAVREQGGKFNSKEVRWYPFQLAFILQELNSFVDPMCPDRRIADLLFFPTGGGKTEAYLGIAAFVIFLRRLRNPNDDGVTVIMRYTLRLLTVQQFQRASMLITACEHIRRSEQLGGSEISIGLWVGGALTPNTLKDASISLQRQHLRQPPNGQATNPVQVLTCPWCGAPLSAKDYDIDPYTQRMVIRCPNERCEFHDGDGLPIRIVDEDIYENLPTYIVATVDKFAQVPKKEESARLFGIGVDKKPPELIIQDELHLITGPLGTMVGIYEFAIERLCERDGIRPKILASTATVRNAGSQIRALYGEDYAQFPPSGTDISDSFFAVQASDREKPNRLYTGIMASGTTQTTVMARVLSDFLFATRYLECAHYPSEVVDAFWTTIGYFCTLRELGGTLTLALDTVQSRFAFLASTKFATLYPGVDAEERWDRILELTSRKNSSEIARSLADLEQPYTPNTSKDCYSFVLATNMISVGVDVPRLSTMVVDSQPKSNSEYIQATSRVGRRYPGLITMVFNASRSRDRSHFEQFTRFHTAMYRNVESTSVTPFSERARDRGLHTILIMLCRYLLPNMSADEDAIKFHADIPGLDKINEEILSYVAQIDPNEEEQTREELGQIVCDWQAAAEDAIESSQPLAYWSNIENCLFHPDTDIDSQGSRFRIMNSMRNVEPSSNIFIAG